MEQDAGKEEQIEKRQKALGAAAEYQIQELQETVWVARLDKSKTGGDRNQLEERLRETREIMRDLIDKNDLVVGGTGGYKKGQLYPYIPDDHMLERNPNEELFEPVQTGEQIEVIKSEIGWRGQPRGVSPMLPAEFRPVTRRPKVS